MKQKNCKYCAGFVYPPDADGKSRAQKITSNGYVTDKKYEFFEFCDNVDDSERERGQKLALQKLNQKFGFNFA